MSNYVYAIGGKAPTGFSDFVASAKLQLPKFIGFGAAAIAGMSFPTGGSQISSHGYDPDLKLPWRRQIDEYWAVDGMFGITWFTTEPHENPSFESTLRIERELGKSATIFAEYAANYPRHARPTDIFDGAALWRVTPRQQLDVHPGLGINRPPDLFLASDIRSVSTGFSRNMPYHNSLANDGKLILREKLRLQINLATLSSLSASSAKSRACKRNLILRRGCASAKYDQNS